MSKIQIQPLEFYLISPSNAPPVGRIRLYPKTDGKFYTKNSQNTEKVLAVEQQYIKIVAINNIVYTLPSESARVYITGSTGLTNVTLKMPLSPVSNQEYLVTNGSQTANINFKLQGNGQPIYATTTGNIAQFRGFILRFDTALGWVRLL